MQECDIADLDWLKASDIKVCQVNHQTQTNLCLIFNATQNTVKPGYSELGYGKELDQWKIYVYVYTWSSSL